MYNFDEGAFELPEGYQDRTIHIFDRRAPAGGEILTMTREPAKERSLDEAVELCLSNAKTHLRRFELRAQKATTIGLLPGCVVRFEFFHEEKGALFQQLAFVAYDGKILTLSLTTSRGAREGAETRFDDLLASLKFRRK